MQQGTLQLNQVVHRTRKASLLSMVALLVAIPACNLFQKTPVLSLQTTPSSVAAGTQVVFTANIDHNNGKFEGANWTLTSGGSPCTPACGTLTNYTNSGSPGNGDTTTITYNAPTVEPSPNSVTITATSIENPKSSQSDTFTITQ